MRSVGGQKVSIQQFRDNINSNISLLKKSDFEVIECHKRTESLSELKIRHKESELVWRECVFWIDIFNQKCYIKSFSHNNTLIGRIITKENMSIEMCTETGQVKLNGKQTQFKDNGLFDVKNLG